MTISGRCYAACMYALAAGVLLVAGCSTRSPEMALPDPDPKAFGSVWLDAGRRELVVSGYVNQVEGPIELLACGPGGKTHESVFVLFATPRDLQAGLLLLGLKHGPPMPGLGMGPPQGDRVRIDVQWEENGSTRRAPAEVFVRDVKTRKAIRHGGWVFNGSMVEQGSFRAEAEESFIATYWDPWAIINIASIAGEDDERLVVNRDTVPPHQAPVRLIIRPEDGRRRP